MQNWKKIALLFAVAALAMSVTACDVEKQMDAMVDNPSFAEPLFTKFMGKAEYQVKAIDTLLGDPATRQMLVEHIAANEEYAKAVAAQLMADPEHRRMMGQMLTNLPPDTITGN